MQTTIASIVILLSSIEIYAITGETHNHNVLVIEINTKIYNLFDSHIEGIAKR